LTKKEILDYFKDINAMYNNPNMLDSLSHMLDEYVPEEKPLSIVKTVSDAIYSYTAKNNELPGCVVLNRAGFEAVLKETAEHIYTLTQGKNAPFNPNSASGDHVSLMGVRVRVIDDGYEKPVVYVTGDWYSYDSAGLYEC